MNALKACFTIWILPTELARFREREPGFFPPLNARTFRIDSLEGCVGPQTLTFDHRIDIISSNILAAVGMDQDVLLPGVTTTKDIYASLMDLRFFRFLRRRSSSRRSRTPSMAILFGTADASSPSPRGRGTRATLTRPAAGLSQRERHDGP